MRRWYCNAMRESRSPPPFNEEPQISKDFWGFFVYLHRNFSSSDFTDESDGNLAYRITHGFPRIFGRWPMLAPEMDSYCFCHADFADDADFFSLIILVPQISRIHTDFLLFPVISSFSLSFLYFADFRPVGLRVWRRFLISWLEKDYADFSNSLFFLFWILWFLYIINLLIRHFSDLYFFYQFRFISLFFYQFLLVSLI